jgi:hypothetical protein
MEHEMLCQRSTNYSYSNRRTVGSCVFCESVRSLYLENRNTSQSCLINVIASFLTDRKFRVLVEGEFSPPRKIAAGVPHGSVLANFVQSIYKWCPRGTWNSSGSVRGLYFYLRDRETRTSFSLQTATRPHCGEFVNININEGKRKSIYFSRKPKVSDNVLQLKGRGVPFVNNVTYLGVTFDSRMTWIQHIEKTIAKTLSTYIRNYSLLRSRHLSTNTKLTLYKALIMSVIIYACPILESAADATAAPAEQSTPHYWKSWQVHTSP